MCRFLKRLSLTDYANRFILKGAMLLHALKLTQARTTLDIDLLGMVNNDESTIRTVIETAIDADVEPDGLEFDKSSIVISAITHAADYEGRRANFRAKLEKIKIALQIDIGFGDRVIPSPRHIELPTLLGFPPGKMRAYLPENSIAEKAHAIVSHGSLNSRMKDYFDIWLLKHSLNLDEKILKEAMAATFNARGSTVPNESVIFSREYLKDTAKQVQWAAFIRKRAIKQAPASFQEVGTEVHEYLIALFVEAGLIRKP
jgi:hypothetical protein